MDNFNGRRGESFVRGGIESIGGNSSVESKSIYLDGYYSIRLGLTGDIESDLCKLYDFYIERLGDSGLDAPSLKETLLEYINIFNSRGLCGQEIIADKISMVSRKGDEKKKNISYLIGCLRYVLENGISSTGSNVENRLIKAFESKYNVVLSNEGVTKLLSLASKEGTLNVLFNIVENDINIEDMLFLKFGEFFKNDDVNRG